MKRKEVPMDSEAKYKTIFDSVNDAIFIHDADTGDILEANRAMTEMFGYKPEEVRRMTMRDISSGAPPYTEEEAVKRIRDAVGKGGSFLEWQVRDKTGRPFWVELSLKPVTIDGRLRVVAVVRDITERKQREEVLRESEQRLRSHAENSPLAIIEWDTDFIVTRWAGEAENIFGWSAEETLGKPIMDLHMVYREDIPIVERTMARLTDGASRKVVSGNRNYTKDGRVITCVWYNSVLWDAQGKMKSVMSEVLDVTERVQAEKVLRASEERYRSLYDNMGQGVMEFDGDGKFVSANRAAGNILGLDLSGMEGSTLEEIFGETPWTRDERKTALRASELDLMHAQQAGKTKTDRKVRILNPVSGEYRWVLVESIPRFKTDYDTLDGMFVIFSDVTELVRVQEDLEKARMELEHRVGTRTDELKNTSRSLEEQKELLQGIVDNIPVVVTVWKPPLKLIMVNKEFEQLSGWSREEALNMDILASAFPDPAYRNRIIEQVRNPGPDWGEFVWTVRSGKNLIISWASTELSDGTRIGIGIDITERKKMQKDLLRLAAAVDQTSEAVVLNSPEGTVEYVNPAYEKITGYGRDEVIGKRADSFTEYFGDYSIREMFNRVIGEGKELTGRQTRKRKTGEIIDVDVSLSPVRDAAGKIINVVSVIRDVTQEVRTQQQLLQAQKMDALGSLAGGIAHDLKNILTPILINTEMALEDVGEHHPAYPILEEANDAAKLGRELVQQILTFSRRSPKKKEPVNVPAVIRETMGFLRSTLPSTIDIYNDLKDECAIAYADPTQIKQVLINLGTNAGQAMREKGGTLGVSEAKIDLDEKEASRISSDLEPGSYIRIEVKDTGHGMDGDTTKRIFEPFFTTKKGEGSGMGLAVAHGIVKEHQGAITVESEPGEGSLFTVLLPALECGSENEPAETMQERG